MNLLLGKLDPEEDSLIEKALLKAYDSKGITTDPATQKSNFPLMADVYNALTGMPNSNSLMKRMEKYVTGTFSNIFNKPTNIDLNKGFVVFNIRDLEASFRPIAMYMVLDFIWAKVRAEQHKRLLIVDEAWQMMEYEDAAKFMYSIAKRARKYYLGLTTITQDVEDFLGSKYGRAIVTNSSLQLLLKQSPASIESIGKTFNLTQGERSLLLESGVGEGLFFAGVNHVAIKVIASYTEDQIVTTSPKQIQELEKAQEEL
jgi:type IV secretory pathway VirB4 component